MKDLALSPRAGVANFVAGLCFGGYAHLLANNNLLKVYARDAFLLMQRSVFFFSRLLHRRRSNAVPTRAHATKNSMHAFVCVVFVIAAATNASPLFGCSQYDRIYPQNMQGFVYYACCQSLKPIVERRKCESFAR